MEQMSFKDLTDLIDRYAELKSERGAHAAERHVAAAKKALANALDAIRAVAEHDELRAREPDSLEAIEAARPRRTHRELHPPEGDAYRERLSGALLARSAGCILGAPVELKKSESMEQWAAQIGDAFPPTDYWSEVPQPESIRYNTSRTDAYTRSNLNAILVDDDLQYTLLGLLILEEHGRDFSTDDVGKSWLRYLPYACTAEDIALGNLRAGVPAEQAGATDGVLPTGAICFASTPDAPTWSQPVDNPYQEWIGADIRCDPYGYVCPGRPEAAARMAYRDAYLSHRRNGVYGSMYFAAAIAAAFSVDDPMEALRIGLEYIPEHCRLAEALRWAFEVAPQIHSHREAVVAIRERFPRMHPVHTINNACLTLWGVSIGSIDVTRVLGETVAMGYDNDCTAATAGSIVGAVVGSRAISEHWTRPFGNRFCSYLTGVPEQRIDDLIDRFARQALR